MTDVEHGTIVKVSVRHVDGARVKSEGKRSVFNITALFADPLQKFVNWLSDLVRIKHMLDARWKY